MTAYRRDIDGLRAVAVLPVVLYHFHIGLFRGGFVGVDVFFVISGFLISTILLEELAAGTYSLAVFYERRARRILPALAVVGAAAFIAGLFILFPADLIEFGKSEIATALFAANIFFWRDTGYFATAVWEKPLLHTWSLGVEEQFYLVYPLVLLGLHRWGGKRCVMQGVAVLAVLSFAASVWAVRWDAQAAFYLIPFRFWELALGGLLAMMPRLTPRWKYSGDAAETDGEYAPCPAFNRRVRAYLDQHPGIQAVFLTGRWSTHGALSVDGSRSDALYRGLARTVQDLRQQGRQVFIVASVPEPGFNAPQCLSRQAAYGGAAFACKPLPRAAYLRQEATTFAVLQRLKMVSQIYYPDADLCRDGVCQIAQANAVYYIDDNHLSTHGALSLTAGMQAAFTALR